jgi:hypothetical protein
MERRIVASRNHYFFSFSDLMKSRDVWDEGGCNSQEGSEESQCWRLSGINETSEEMVLCRPGEGAHSRNQGVTLADWQRQQT